MKLFLTGGTGFIGTHFAAQALAAGHEVKAIRRPGDRARLPLANEPQWLEGSLADDWRAHLTGCDALIHLAAAGVSPQKATWEELFTVNVQQSIALWLQAAEVGVKRLVISGSCIEYGRSGEHFSNGIPANAPLDPIDSYAASKAAASMAALALSRARNMEVLILRLFHAYGDGQYEGNFWPSLKRAALAGEDFSMTAGEQVCDFVPVTDAAAAFLKGAARTDLAPGQPIVEHVGSGKAQTLREFAEGWWRHWNATGKLLVGARPYRGNEIMRCVPASTTPVIE